MLIIFILIEKIKNLKENINNIYFDRKNKNFLFNLYYNIYFDRKNKKLNIFFF
jgi:hypothetical protein